MGVAAIGTSTGEGSPGGNWALNCIGHLWPCLEFCWSCDFKDRRSMDPLHYPFACCFNVEALKGDASSLTSSNLGALFDVGRYHRTLEGCLCVFNASVSVSQLYFWYTVKGRAASIIKA